MLKLFRKARVAWLRRKAVDALTSVRAGFQWKREDLNRYLANAGLSLEDIGSSEEEMKRLWLKSEKLALSGEWGRIQLLARYGPVDAELKPLRERLASAELNLVDLDPPLSEEVLETERLRGWKSRAVAELEMLRGKVIHDQDIPARHAPLLREALAKAGLSPSDIGTSYEEIARLESDKWLPFTPTG